RLTEPVVTRMIVWTLMLAALSLAAASAEARDEAARALARWEANRRTDAAVAYDAGRDFLRRAPQAAGARPVRSWIAAYEQVSAATRKAVFSADEAITFLREHVQGTQTLLDPADLRPASIEYGAFALQGCILESRFIYDDRFVREGGERRDMTSVIDLTRINP